MYTYWFSTTGLSDAFNITFTWDATASAFAAAFPFTPPDAYEFTIGDGDDRRFARSTFRHSADCLPARQAALTNHYCDQCSGVNTWVYRRGSYGMCVPSTDLPSLTGVGFLTGCPAGYLGLLTQLTPIFQKGNATYQRAGGSLVTVRASLRVVNPTNALSGTGTVSWRSAYYPFVTAVNGTWTPRAASYDLEFSATVVLDPWTSNLSDLIEVSIELPGQLGRLLQVTLPFRPGGSLYQPESQAGVNKPLMFNFYGSFNGRRPFFITQIANPELVVSIRTYLTLFEGSSPARDFDISRVDACRNCSVPAFGTYFPAYVWPDSSQFGWNPRDPRFPFTSGVHRINVVINEGRSTEERLSDWFALLDYQDAREVLGAIKNGGSWSDSCSAVVDPLVICFEAGFNMAPSTFLPGLSYPYGQYVKMGIVVNGQLPIKLPDSVDVAPARFAMRYTNQLWFRGEQTTTGNGEGEIVIPVRPPSGARLAAGFRLGIAVEQEIYGIAPGQSPEVRNIRISSAAVITISLQIPVYRYSMGPLSVKVDVFFQFGIGPTQVFCNQGARYQRDCDVDPVANRPGWTVAPGYVMELRVRASASAGIPLLFSCSIWTEFTFRTASLRIRNDAGNIEHRSGVSVGFRLCGSATYFFITTSYCAIDYTYTTGTIPNTGLSWKKRSVLVSGELKWDVLGNQWPQQFQQMAAPQTWESKRRRAIPVADEGVIVAGVIPSANPISASGLGSSSGLALLAWTGVDGSRPMPQGAVVVFSVYNSTSEKLSDPLWLRQTSDADTPSSLVALPDGRFLVLFSSIPDQGTANSQAVLAKTELQSVLFDPLTSSWNQTMNMTTDGQYFDGFSSAVVFTDSSNNVRVLAVWIRSLDSVTAYTTQKQLLWAVFDPAANSWSAPTVLVTGAAIRVSASLAVTNTTILLGYVDNQPEINQTVAFLHKFNTVSGTWAGASVAIGRNYAFVNGTWNETLWEVPNALQFQQESIVVARKTSQSFVVVWTDANVVFSRIYTIEALNTLFAAPATPQPAVQPVWRGEGALPRNLAILSISGGSQIGQILTWINVVGGANYWYLDFMRQPSNLWEGAPIEAPHDVHENVLFSSLFAATPDTGFAILSSQQVLRYANQTEYLGSVSIEYKRLNLLPILVLDDASVALPSVQSTSPYEVRIVPRNKGLLPSESFVITIVQGDVSGPFSTDSNATVTMPTISPGAALPYYISSVPARSYSDAGYLWVVISNSSTHPLRLPTFNVEIRTSSVEASDVPSRVAVTASIVCSPLLSASSPYRDSYAVVPVQVYTRDTVASKDLLLGSTSVNCSLDGVSVARALYLVNPALLAESVTVSLGALDDFVPASYVAPNRTTTITVAPDLQMYGPNQVVLVDPFVGRAHYQVSVYNGGLVQSRNVTVNVTVGSPSGPRVVASVFIPSVQPLRSVAVDVALSPQVLTDAGLYNFTVSAFSLPSIAANAMVNAAIAANQSYNATADYEKDVADNTRYFYNVRLYAPWKPRFGQNDVYVRADPSLTMSLWIANAALDVAAVSTPIRFYVVADNLPITLLGETVMGFLNKSSAQVVSITPSANSGSVSAHFAALQNAKLIASIPALFSGSPSAVEVVTPLSVALSNPVPTLSKSFAGEPGLVIPATVYMNPNETLYLLVPYVNFDSQRYGQLQVRQTQGAEFGIAFDNNTRLLSFDSSTVAAPATVVNTLVVVLPSGSIFETYTTQIAVGALAAASFPLPPLEPPAAAPTQVGAPVSVGAPTNGSDVPSESAPAAVTAPSGQIAQPPSDSSSAAGGSSAAGIAIGIIFALIAIAFIILAVLFIRRKHRGDKTADSVKLFFMPWKKDSAAGGAAVVKDAESNSAPLVPVAGASKRPKAKAQSSEEESPESSSPLSEQSESNSNSNSKSASQSSSKPSGSDGSDAEEVESQSAQESAESLEPSEDASASASASQSHSVSSPSGSASRAGSVSRSASSAASASGSDSE